jgi:hypothetical protein
LRCNLPCESRMRDAGQSRSQGGEAMNTQEEFVDRRERPRVGSMALLENITYSILRKQQVAAGLSSERADQLSRK